MYKLSFLILLTQLVAVNITAQSSPHGEKLSNSCFSCHIRTEWTSIVINKDSFNHDKTSFPLVGKHQAVACKKCHVDLIFTDAKMECNSCHLNIHQPSVGSDCELCHTSDSWIIKSTTHRGQFDVNGKTDCTKCHGVESWKKIKFDHTTSRFKLEGAHALVKCNECHKEVIDEKGKYIQYKFKSIECTNCHS